MDLLARDSLPIDFPWRKNIREGRAARGLIKTDLGVMLIAASPILDGNEGGPVHGMVIMQHCGGTNAGSTATNGDGGTRRRGRGDRRLGADRFRGAHDRHPLHVQVRERQSALYHQPRDRHRDPQERQ